MLNEACVLVENVKNCKLLALFNSLDEGDKDIVITISELLVEKWKLNMTNIAGNNVLKNSIKGGKTED